MIDCGDVQEGEQVHQTDERENVPIELANNASLREGILALGKLINLRGKLGGELGLRSLFVKVGIGNPVVGFFMGGLRHCNSVLIVIRGIRGGGSK